MYIKNLKIENFRNYEVEEINFIPKINIIYGNNAQGKTNILEAIFYGSLGRSFRTNKDKDLIKFEEIFSNIDIAYQKKDRDGKINIKIANRKFITLNGVKIKKLSDLIGNINVVIFTPDDINILKGGPENRRNFLDVMISQLRPQYVYNLSNYKKTLEQRNKYLKQENRQEAMLEIWDQKLADFGFNIYTYRREFVDKLISKVKDIHKNITNEEIRIEYSSDCKDKEEYLAHLKRNRHIDFAREYTSCGVHRDDFKTYLDDKEIGTFGSQGQNRTAVLSLKLSEIEVINDEIGEYPILLLDDFMSELDQTRIKKFLGSVQAIQVIITCNNKIDIENSQLFEVKEGRVEAT